MNKVSSEPLTDEMLCELAADAMYDVMVYGMNVGYVTLQDIHLAIGRAVEQAHGIGVKQWNALTDASLLSATTSPPYLGGLVGVGHLLLDKNQLV